MLNTYKVECTYEGHITFAIYTPLMMVQDRPEISWKPINYGCFIKQFPPDTIKSMRWLERIYTKMDWQRMSILLNEICLNEEMLPKYTNTHTHTHTHTHIYIYIYIYIYIDVSRFLLFLLVHQSWKLFVAVAAKRDEIFFAPLLVFLYSSLNLDKKSSIYIYIYIYILLGRKIQES